nr:glutathione gamma-glutamylcysteinyltransferase-like [Lytechinus pictus]
MLDIIPKVSLDSPEGQALLRESSIKQTLLIRLSSKQLKNGFCGFTSVAHIMSFHALARKYPDTSLHDHCDVSDIRYTEVNIFDHKETQSVLGTAEYFDKRFQGASLTEIEQLLKLHGLSVVTKLGNESDAEEFRRLAKEALSSNQSGVILNFYHFSKVKWGHFSPLAAYHEKTDRFLLLDTRDDHPYVWVRVADLFPLINTLDSLTKKSRGFLIATSNQNKLKDSSV